jgi:hypothetical protein
VRRQFLATVAALVPESCKPIVITNAGFYAPWFLDMTELCWDFVGRVRGTTCGLLEGLWRPLKTLYARATKRPNNVGVVTMRRTEPCSFRLVLSAAPMSVSALFDGLASTLFDGLPTSASRAL